MTTVKQKATQSAQDHIVSTLSTAFTHCSLKTLQQYTVLVATCCQNLKGKIHVYHGSWVWISVQNTPNPVSDIITASVPFLKIALK